MIVLYILLAVFLLLLALLLLPLELKVEYLDEFNFKLTYIGITLINSKKQQASKEQKSGENTKKEENFFVRLFNEKPFPDFLKIIISLLKKVVSTLRYILKHIKIRKLSAKIIVASGDAATTGIYYGVVCATLYTFLEFLESNIDISFKKVDVNADFENNKSSVQFSSVIKISPLFLIIAAAVFSKYYLEITKKEGSASNERK